MLLRCLLLIVVVAELLAQEPAKESVFNRVCKWMGLNPALYSRMATRGGDVEPAGNRLMRCDLRTRKPELLWDCGECWSPIIMSEVAAAVAKADGIWRVPLDGSSPAKILSENKIAILVGASPTDAQQLLVLMASSEGPSATYTPRLADLRMGKLADTPVELRGIYKKDDLAAFPRPDAFRGDLLLSTSQDTPMRMLVARVTITPTVSLGDNEELLPGVSGKGVERFRPIWSGTDSILFLERGK